MQTLKIDIYDCDDKSNTKNLRKHDKIGFIECSLGKIVGNRGRLQIPISCYNTKQSTSKMSTITLTVEEVNGNANLLHLQFAARNLDKVDWAPWNKSDPFLVIEKKMPDSSWLTIWKSEVIMKNLNPRWEQVTLPIQQLCSGEYDRALRISCFDWDSDGSTTLIGCTESSIFELMNHRRELSLINPSKIKHTSYKDSGVLKVEKIDMEERFTMIDYLKGGLNLNLTVAIDFTGR